MHKAEYISDRFFSTMVKVQSSGHAGRTLATDGCWWKRTRLIGQRLAVQAEARLEDHFQFPNVTRGIRDPGSGMQK